MARPRLGASPAFPAVTEGRLWESADPRARRAGADKVAPWHGADRKGERDGRSKRSGTSSIECGTERWRGRGPGAGSRRSNACDPARAGCLAEAVCAAEPGAASRLARRLGVRLSNALGRVTHPRCAVVPRLSCRLLRQMRGITRPVRERSWWLRRVPFAATRCRSRENGGNRAARSLRAASVAMGSLDQVTRMARHGGRDGS